MSILLAFVCGMVGVNPVVFKGSLFISASLDQRSGEKNIGAVRKSSEISSAWSEDGDSRIAACLSVTVKRETLTQTDSFNASIRVRFYCHRSCNEESMIHMSLERPLLLATFALIIFVTLGCNRNIPQASTSSELPLPIQPASSPTDGDIREPELNPGDDGRIILSWVERVAEKRYALRLSLRDVNGWSEPRTVAEGENWFVNWADFPSAIVLRDGSLAAHWLVKRGKATYAYDVNIARSTDGGKTWSDPIVPHHDKTQTEHGFVSLIPLAEGRLGVVWLDGRNMKDMKKTDEHAAAPESMTLRYAAIDRNGNLSDEAELDNRVCECCQTSAAVTSDGPIAVYRDRSAAEVRDIYIVRRVNGSWSAPQAIYADNWQINGCPVNGPSVAADGRRVVVAWFTSVGDAPHVKIAFSEDAGASFNNPIQVDDGETLGRVDTLLLSDGSALVCWLSGNVEGGAIKVRRVQADGKVGPPSVIAKTDISRSSGFPRMARFGNEVHFAWTEFAKPSHVRTATVDVSPYK